MKRTVAVVVCLAFLFSIGRASYADTHNELQALGQEENEQEALLKSQEKPEETNKTVETDGTTQEKKEVKIAKRKSLLKKIGIAIVVVAGILYLICTYIHHHKQGSETDLETLTDNVMPIPKTSVATPEKNVAENTMVLRKK